MIRGFPPTPDGAVHPSPILANLASRAKSGQQALIPGNGDRVGYWLTPPKVMERLHAEFNFDYDACPFPRPAGYDGLHEEWGRSTWVNPPFNGMTAWARKSILENKKGKTVVFIFELDKWLMDFIEAGAEFRRLEPFRWLDPKGREQPKAPGRAQVLHILRGRDGEPL